MRFKKQIVNGFPLIVCEFNDDWIEYAIEIAKLKMQFTMNYDQNGNKRNYITKLNNQLQGILAECGIQNYFAFIANCFEINDISFQRYDEVRVDGFSSPKNEYDLKIINGQKEWIVESRSSKLYDINNISEQKIIGKYQNQYKGNEKESDLYIKTCFYIRDKNKTLLDNFLCKKSIVIMAGATRKMMLKNGYIGNLNQANTQYHLLNIKKENQMDNFNQNLISLFLFSQLDFQKENKQSLKFHI